jgi:hypothetical protein
MSSLTMPPAVTPTLPAVNLPPHGHGGHGHKKGSPLDPTSSSTSTAATPTAVGTAQNLLGSLFSSLQQVIGGTPVGAAANLVASATNAAPGSTASAAAVGSAAAAAPKINVMA